jgi:hypothetical protein
MWEWRYGSTILDLGTRWMWLWSSLPSHFSYWKTLPDTHWKEGFLGLRAGLHAMGKAIIVLLSELEPLPPSPSINRLQRKSQFFQQILVQTATPKCTDFHLLVSEIKHTEGHTDIYIYFVSLWSEYASELYRLSDHRLSTKLVPIFCR